MMTPALGFQLMQAAADLAAQSARCKPRVVLAHSARHKPVVSYVTVNGIKTGVITTARTIGAPVLRGCRQTGCQRGRRCDQQPTKWAISWK